jgi:hypothetical protein
VRTERLTRDGKRTPIGTEAQTKLYWIKNLGPVFLKRDMPHYVSLYICKVRHT